MAGESRCHVAHMHSSGSADRLSQHRCMRFETVQLRIFRLQNALKRTDGGHLGDRQRAAARPPPGSMTAGPALISGVECGRLEMSCGSESPESLPIARRTCGLQGNGGRRNGTIYPTERLDDSADMADSTARWNHPAKVRDVIFDNPGHVGTIYLIGCVVGQDTSPTRMLTRMYNFLRITCVQQVTEQR